MSTTGRRRWVVLGIVFGTFLAFSIPAIGNPGEQGNREVTESVSGGGDFGRFSAANYANGFSSMAITGVNPDGGQYGGSFDCQFWGDGPITLPDTRKAGLDTMQVSLSIDTSEFDYCVGDYPEVVTYDIVIVADTVEQIISKEHRTILKGEGYETKWTSRWISGYGSGEGTLTGTFMGAPVEGWSYGGFSFLSRTTGGAPSTTVAP